MAGKMGKWLRETFGRPPWSGNFTARIYKHGKITIMASRVFRAGKMLLGERFTVERG